MRQGFACLLILCLLAPPAFGDVRLIHEIEQLRNSLPESDPSRTLLDLKLADAYSNECIHLSGEVNNGRNSLAQRQQDYRDRAIRLYRQALARKRAGDTDRVSERIWVQLGSLYSDEGRDDLAQPYWEKIAKRGEHADWQRDATLKLAEIQEKTGRKAALDQAKRLYAVAIQMGQGTDVAPYAHYRLALIDKKEGDGVGATREMEEALWDAKGQIREEALSEMIGLYSGTNVPVAEALEKVTALAGKLKRPTLLIQLADALFAAGRRPDGIRVLTSYQALNPSFITRLRLLEELYGVGAWDEFRETIERAREEAGSALPQERKRGEAILRRLLVELDAELRSSAVHRRDFKDLVELYLVLFPSSPERLRLVQNWCAAEPDDSAKMERLGEWLENREIPWTPEQVRALGESRASLAQKHRQLKIVEEEMDRCLSTSPAPELRRKYEAWRAASLFDAGDFDRALPELHSLAHSGNMDAISARSEALYLRILTSREKFQEAIEESTHWASVAGAGTGSSLGKDIRGELATISSLTAKARFDQALRSPDNKQSLALFLEFCLSKQFVPTSCANAKTLAVKQKDQAVLIRLLEAERPSEALASEYEVAGYFLEAARIWERLAVGKTVTAPGSLKVALLYELAGDVPDRDRILTRLETSFEKRSAMGDLEDSVYGWVSSSRLVTTDTLRLPWKKDNRCRLANELAQGTSPPGVAVRTLLNCDATAGAAWPRVVLERLAKLDQVQGSVSFYGRRAKAKFDRRCRLLSEYVAFAQSSIERADPKTRAEIAEKVSHSYEKMASEIKASPITSQARNEAEKKSIEASLAGMAAPFDDKAREFGKLAESQESKFPRPVQSDKKAPGEMVPRSAFDAALEDLHRDPTDLAALGLMKAYYQGQDRAPLASYFEARIAQVKGEQK